MGKPDLVVVFDIGEVGYKNWDFVSHGAMFIFLSLALILIPSYFPKIRQLIDPSDRQRSVVKWLPRVMLAFSLLWTATAFAATYAEYRSLLSAYETGSYDVVEGRVDDFVPMPRDRRPNESFSVNGVKFSYSDFHLSSGFNNTSSYGGAIAQGLYVRVYYIGGTIIRLETEPRSGANREIEGNSVAGEREQAPEFDSKGLLIFEFFSRFFWYVAQTFLVVGSAFRWRSRGRGFAGSDVAMQNSYKRLTDRLLLWGLFPPAMAMLVYLSKYGFTLMLAERPDWYVYAFANFLVAFRLGYWVFTQDGAMHVAKHPGFINYPWVVKVYSAGALIWTVVLLVT